MKHILPMIVFFGMSSAFATEKVCDVTVTTPAGTVKTTEVLQPYVLPNADIASYRMDKNIEGFDVFVSEVDGNYYGAIRVNGTKVTTEDVDSITLSSSYKNRSLSLYCY